MLKEYNSREKMFRLSYPNVILDGSDVDGFNKAIATAMDGFNDPKDYSLSIDADSYGAYGINGTVVRIVAKNTGNTLIVIGIKGRRNLLFDMISLPSTV